MGEGSGAVFGLYFWWYAERIVCAIGQVCLPQRESSLPSMTTTIAILGFVAGAKPRNQGTVYFLPW